MDINICHRKVIFEKFNIDVFKLNSLKQRLYKSVIRSKQISMISVNDEFVECISAMIHVEFKNRPFDYLNPEEFGEFFHFAFAGCIQGLKFYRLDLTCDKCYLYFKEVIHKSAE